MTFAVTFIELVLVVSTAQVPPDPSVDQPMNIVFILADDLGWSHLGGEDVGAFSSDFFETPNINALAREGMRFTQAYTEPVCSPTRASFLTGRHAARLGMTHIAGREPRGDRDFLEPHLVSPLADEELTIAERLGQAGYVTGHFGKWHVTPHPRDWFENVRSQGFDTTIVKEMIAKRGDWDNHRVQGLTNAVTQFIEDKKDEPFFVYLAHSAPHGPHESRPDLVSKFAAKTPGQVHSNVDYAALVAELDESVGTVVSKIDELGLTDNTLVVFASDNGATPSAGSSLPFRGGKGELNEGGVRVPTIARLPGLIEAGTVSDTPIVPTDYLPTFLELTGVEDAGTATLDGESLVPVLTGRGDVDRETLYWHYPHYVKQHTTPMGAIRHHDWKLLEYFEDGRMELFDLANDPGEQHNLTDSMPKKAAELRQMLEDWRQEVGAKMPRINPHRISAGISAALIWDGDDPGDQAREEWVSTIHNTSKPQSWQLGTGESQDSIPVLVDGGSYRSFFPNQVFAFDGVDDGMIIGDGFKVSSGFPEADDSVAFEIWFRLEDRQAGGQLLFETGALDRGLSLTLGNGHLDKSGHDDEIYLHVRDGGTKVWLFAELGTYTDPSREFVQVVASIDESDEGNVALYINGHRARNQNLNGVGMDWDKRAGAGLGIAAGQVGAMRETGADDSDPLPFRGEIAMFRFYKHRLKVPNVQRIYNATLGPADEGVVSKSSSVQIPEVRPSLLKTGRIEDDEKLIIFHERQQRLNAPLEVDWFFPEKKMTLADEVICVPGMTCAVPAGTLINSYLLHFDPEGSESEESEIEATLTFADPIVGIFSASQSLIDSDFLLGVVGRSTTFADRGIEPALDAFEILDERHTLSLRFTSTEFDIDQLRIVTVASVVPLPSGWQLGLCTLLVLTGAKVAGRWKGV